MKNILVVPFLFVFFVPIACSNEELVVLSCSGEQTGVDIKNIMESYEKKFSNVVIKIRKLNGEIVAVIVHEEELTKERRAINPESPNFFRWFETTSDGIITYGEDVTSNRGPEWNIKLSSQGEFERQGVVSMQRGTCTVQQKAF